MAQQERRRYPRTSAALEVTLEVGGSLWQAKTLDLSPYGAKVAVPEGSEDLAPGRSVQLRFPRLDQHAPISLTARVARMDSDGLALTFPTLEEQQFARLKELVDALLLREWQEVLSELTGPQKPAGGLRNTTELPPPAKEQDNHQPAAVTGPCDDEELERLKVLLHRRGLGSLQLPPDGTLARQWREFLRRLEAEG